MTTAIALLAVVPMQLAAAAGVELAGGYDSTVLDQRTLYFGDGVISRAAVDLQFGHRTETFRQLLRTRGEFYFTSGEGRDVSQSDLVRHMSEAMNKNEHGPFSQLRHMRVRVAACPCACILIYARGYASPVARK